jgi:uncharacterized protein with NRDE domain
VCLIVTLLQVHPEFPLIVAANRDERRDRPSTPPHEWEGDPTVWAGRDQDAGGTWLGVNAHGMVVGVTNRRPPGTEENDPSRPSRGQLCLNTLRQTSLTTADELVEQELAAHVYNPFNLQCVDVSGGWVRDWKGHRWTITPGIHVLSNFGDLDDQSIPVIRRANELLREMNLTEPDLDQLLATLARICADQGSDPQICRVGGERGTVSSSLIAVRADRTVAAYRHAPGPPIEHAYQAVDLTRSPVVHSG